MTCTYCGATVPADAATCPVCGNAPAAADAPRSDAPTDQPTSEPVWYGAGDPGAGDPGAGGYGQAGQGGYGGHGSGWDRPAQPHPSGLPSELRTYGVVAHLSAYAAFIGLPVIGPLLVWLLKREEPFVDHHGKEALNFNLSVLIYSVVGAAAAVPLGILTIGIALVPLALLGLALAIFWLVCPILAAVKASNGEGYRYPLTVRLVR